MRHDSISNLLLSETFLSKSWRQLNRDKRDPTTKCCSITSKRVQKCCNIFHSYLGFQHECCVAGSLKCSIIRISIWEWIHKAELLPDTLCQHDGRVHVYIYLKTQQNFFYCCVTALGGWGRFFGDTGTSQSATLCRCFYCCLKLAELVFPKIAQDVWTKKVINTLPR